MLKLSIMNYEKIIKKRRLKENFRFTSKYERTPKSDTPTLQIKPQLLTASQVSKNCNRNGLGKRKQKPFSLIFDNN